MESAQQENRQELWWTLRAQAGDREALEELLKLVQGPLYRYIFSLTGARPLAEDVLQEVLLLICRKLHWLREPELFRPWAYRIATREAFRQLKRERRWAAQTVDEAVLAELPAPAPESRAADLLEHLPRLLAQVSPASRAVLVLHYLHEMPLGEVAAVLEIAPGTVKSRLAYGLQCLRKQLLTE